jgi:hypothetical protein
MFQERKVCYKLAMHTVIIKLHAPTNPRNGGSKMISDVEYDRLTIIFILIALNRIQTQSIDFDTILS